MTVCSSSWFDARGERECAVHLASSRTAVQGEEEGQSNNRGRRE